MLDAVVMPVLMVALGFVFLSKGASWLVDGASALARAFGVSDFVVGLTVVAFGTSLPELVVNLFAAFQGHMELALGDVLGSNTCNILLILGLCALVRPLPVPRKVAGFELPLVPGVVALLSLLLLPGELRAWGGAVLLLCFALFLRISVRRGDVRAEEPGEKRMRPGKAVFYVLAGLAALVGGGRMIVSGATEIARMCGMGEGAIGMTVVAVGTSLPELAASVAAQWRGNAALAVGNIVGSNIFNVLLVLGATALVAPIPAGPEAWAQVAVTLGSGALLLACLFLKPASSRLRLGKLSGALFLACYALVVAWSLAG
ncbi:MAG: calcium/sodium antiporter [Fibrobacterales bacterium]|nr:calcium/sodium antiporter [Fibrobacterales bacterium]